MKERVAGTSYLNFARSISYMFRMLMSILFVQNFRKDREDIEYVNIIESYFICCVIMCFFFIMKKIKKAKLKIEYALFWIVSSILLLILSIFPQIAYFLQIYAE